MDYVSPPEIMNETMNLAKTKASLAVRDLLLRGILAGAFLGYATSLALIVNAQGLPAIVGAALFPAGFAMLVLLGLELATGNFALLPPAVLAGNISLFRLLRNWVWVYLGNLIGAVLYAALFYVAITNSGTSNGGAVGDQLRQLAQKKTLAYATLGTNGWATAFVKGMLCNWMVTLGTVLALASRSAIGKIAAMWLPIMTFFALGYEHSIVNMYVLPAGMMLGAPVSLKSWWFWNQIPVTLGNIVSGTLFTGLALYFTYVRKPRTATEPLKPAELSAPVEIVAPSQAEVG